MKQTILKQILIALILAVLAGLSVSTSTQAKPNNLVIVTKALRSQAHYDGNVIEYADDYWTGGRVNSTATTITIGDDNLRKNWIGVLDFDTAQLPDSAAIIGVFLQLHVVRFNTLYGNPYAMLGDIYAELTTPYYGSSRNLEIQDFNWMWSTTYAGILPQATGANQKVVLEVDASALWQVSVTQPTQFMLYFLDDNEDTLPQGVTFASGNYSVASNRPTLIVYFYYP